MKVVEEGLQGLVQDLVGGFSRMDVASARPMAGPAVQFLDVPALQALSTSSATATRSASVMSWAA